MQRLTLQTLNLASWVQIPVRPVVPSGFDSMVSGKFIFYLIISSHLILTVLFFNFVHSSNLHIAIGVICKFRILFLIIIVIYLSSSTAAALLLPENILVGVFRMLYGMLYFAHQFIDF